MKTANAIEKAGSQAQLAGLLGITSSAIAQWGEDMPQARVWQLRVVRPDWFENTEQKQPHALDCQSVVATKKQAA